MKICSTILRNYMICCVYVCMYEYEMVCISMHEYLLAPSKVWTLFLTKNCKFVVTYWRVTWSVACYYWYVWVWNGMYKYARVFISPQQGLNSSPAHISAVWRATGLKFRTYAIYYYIYYKCTLQICSTILRSNMIYCMFL